VVLSDKAGKRFTNDETHIQLLAWIRASRSTGAFKDNNVIWILQYDISSMSERDDLLWRSQMNFFLHSNQFFGCFQGYNFSMIIVSGGAAVRILW
jgi:hypothetical protein